MFKKNEESMFFSGSDMCFFCSVSSSAPSPVKKILNRFNLFRFNKG